jgi:arylsulfatase A-like enzyme
MKKVPFLTLVLGLISMTAFAQTRPNILYFYVDDMGYGSIGPNGQDTRRANNLPAVQTPHIDSLAAAGINFQRAYGAPVCSPARSSQQTGYHQGHTYADRNDPDNARKAMRADDLTMGKALKAAGYVTGYWGKWGYGAESDQNNPAILNEQTLPNNHGYDYVLAELHHVRAHTFFQPTLWKYEPGDSQIQLVPNSMAAYTDPAQYPQSPANQNDPAYPSTAYCDDVYAMHCLDFVRQQAQNYNNTGTPFFALFAPQIPHAPFDEVSGLPGYADAYASDPHWSGLQTQSRQWAAMVTRIDAHIGNILAALEDPNGDGDTSDSVADNTLVIFQSDNGGPDDSADNTDQYDANGGLYGHKGSVNEGGIRVPLVMRWPAGIDAQSPIPAGSNSQRIVDVTDLLPTFCELAGIEIPTGLDGVSIAPSLTGIGHQRTRDFIIHEDQPNRSIIRGDLKLIDANGSFQLYDLSVSETSNIAGANPDLVSELSTLLLGENVRADQWEANTYHDWTGTDGASISDAANWSDYVYSEGGTIYDSESGAPRIPWTATMHNTGGSDNTAVVDAPTEFLSLELEGSSPAARQIVDVGAETLTARNELRLKAHSKLTLDNGTIQSQRWIDLREGATLSGAGSLDASVYHSGSLQLGQASETIMPGPDITVPGPDISLTDGQQFITNGGFENGTDSGDGDYSYTTLEDWFTDGPDSSNDGAKPNNAHTGVMRGLINTGYPLIQNTGFPFLLGDSYTLSFQHRGFYEWDTGETAIVRVFYEDAGERTDVFTASLPLTNGTWNQASYSIPAITDPNADGKTLFVSLGPDGGEGFASFDEVSLIRHGPATTVPGPDITVPGPDIIVPGHRRMEVSGDYHAFDGAVLDVSVAGAGTPGEDHSQLQVTGSVTLAGTLAVTVDPDYMPSDGNVLTIVTADSISGTFSNPQGRVADNNGNIYDIAYPADNVTLTVNQSPATTRGTPHAWLEFYQIDGGAPEAADLIDHDGDGMFAWEEYLAGTIPTDRSSFFSAAISGPSSDLEIRWPSTAGRTYTVHQSADLVTPFTPFAGPFTATPPENVFAIPEGPARQFFRIEVGLE